MATTTYLQNIIQSASSLSFTALIGLFGVYYIGLLWFKQWKWRRESNVHNLVTPEGASLIWGHEKEAWSHTYGEKYLEWINKLGDTISIKGALGYGDLVVTVDRKVMSHIFTKRVYDYPKSLVIRGQFGRVLGKSLVWAEGEDHHRQKAAIGPAFTAESVKKMETAVLESNVTLMNVLREHVASVIKENKAKGVNDDTALLNAFDWSGRSTLDVIGRVCFGFDFDCGRSDAAKEVHRMWRGWTNTGLSQWGFVAANVLRALPFISSLPFKEIKAQDALRDRIRELVRPFAEERIAILKENGGVPTAPDGEEDVMSYLIRGSIVSGGKIDMDELLDHMNTMVQVGHETTSGVVSYSLAELARHGDIQDKLRAEVEEFGKEPDYDDLHNPKLLPYLDAVCKEALRLYPTASHTERVALHDDVIPLATPVVGKDGQLIRELVIKKGQIIVVPFLTVNTHASVWGDDGTTFRPSRWLDPSNPAPKAMTGGWQNLATFNEGPHTCTGFRLAIFEYKAIMASIIKNFRLVDTGLKVETRYMATMQPFVIGGQEDPKTKGVNLPLKFALIDNE